MCSYWFAGPKDSDKRKLYEVLYQGSVSGLREGNAVLFNGIPVGQVTKLGLVPGAPNEVLVQIGVRNDVPFSPMPAPAWNLRASPASSP